MSGSETGKGFTYAINQEQYLRTFLAYPNVPLDNNEAERAIRSFTVGRKNRVLVDTTHGARVSAILYSIVETAKENNLKLNDYLEYLLTELPKHVKPSSSNIPDSLMPWSKELPEKLYK